VRIVEPPTQTASVAATLSLGNELPKGSVRHATRPNPVRELTAQHVLHIHEALVVDFASSPDPIFPPGVKHPDMLESAVGRQHTALGGVRKYTTHGHVAASLFFGLALNHPFHNGNKRTAIVSLLCFADMNGLNLTASEGDLYDFVLKVVNHGFRPISRMSETEATDREVQALAGWITPRLRRKAHFNRSVKWRDLRNVLAVHGVACETASGSQLECVRGPKRSVVDFDGDTKEVGPAIVRKLRRDLQLTERHGCDDAVFYGEEARPDYFIVKYRGLLHDLASV
jgi:death-on-curing protein